MHFTFSPFVLTGHRHARCFLRQVTALLAGYLKDYGIAPELDEEEVRHWLSFQVGWLRWGAVCRHSAAM